MSRKELVIMNRSETRKRPVKEGFFGISERDLLKPFKRAAGKVVLLFKDVYGIMVDTSGDEAELDRLLAKHTSSELKVAKGARIRLSFDDYSIVWDYSRGYAFFLGDICLASFRVNNDHSGIARIGLESVARAAMAGDDAELKKKLIAHAKTIDARCKDLLVAIGGAVAEVNDKKAARQKSDNDRTAAIMRQEVEKLKGIAENETLSIAIDRNRSKIRKITGF